MVEDGNPLHKALIVLQTGCKYLSWLAVSNRAGPPQRGWVLGRRHHEAAPCGPQGWHLPGQAPQAGHGPDKPTARTESNVGIRCDLVGLPFKLDLLGNSVRVYGGWLKTIRHQIQRSSPVAMFTRIDTVAGVQSCRTASSRNNSQRVFDCYNFRYLPKVNRLKFSVDIDMNQVKEIRKIRWSLLFSFFIGWYCILTSLAPSCYRKRKGPFMLTKSKTKTSWMKICKRLSN